MTFLVADANARKSARRRPDMIVIVFGVIDFGALNFTSQFYVSYAILFRKQSNYRIVLNYNRIYHFNQSNTLCYDA